MGSERRVVRRPPPCRPGCASARCLRDEQCPGCAWMRAMEAEGWRMIKAGPGDSLTFVRP